MKKKLALIISLTLALCMLVSSGCSTLKASEDDGSVTAGEQQKAVEKEKAPVEIDLSEKKEKATEEKKEEVKKEEPAESKPEEKAEAAKTEAKVEEKAEEPKAEAKPEEKVAEEINSWEKSAEQSQEKVEEVVPETVEQEAVAAEEKITSEEPVEEPATEEIVEEKFTGKVEVRMLASEDIAFGDKVTLKAVVSEANKPYSIRWEVYEDGEWVQIGTGEAYSFVVSEENCSLSYRAVLVSKDD